MLNISHYLSWVLLFTLVVGVTRKHRVIKKPCNQTTHEGNSKIQNFKINVNNYLKKNAIEAKNTYTKAFRHSRSLDLSQDEMASEHYIFSELSQRFMALNEALDYLQETVSQLNIHLHGVTASPKSSATTEAPTTIDSVTNGTCNLETHFLCDNSTCFLQDLLCNGEVDCEDGSDESDCIKEMVICAEDQFSCLSGERCLPPSWRCDGDDDCLDLSDEKGCLEVECQVNHIKCASGDQCISSNWKCDGDKDCEDGSDEEDCIPVECNEKEFKCLSGTRCILAAWQCDGDDDCPDNSDEDGCIQAVCREGYFRCSSGDKCVHSLWRCDGDNDCSDASDESGCNFSSLACDENEFKCLSDDKCIRASWRCDGDNDCSDASDEVDCDKQKKCNESEFQCASQEQCIPQIEVCNGVQNCQDNSDEAECSGHSVDKPTETPIDVFRKSEEQYSTEPPTETPDESLSEVLCILNQFRCSSKNECIPLEWHCDGEDDCQDGSDEEDCGEVVCDKDQFKCTFSARCIPLTWNCDGVNDCDNGSDEAGCKVTCTGGQFQCDNGHCISSSWRCDDQRDCLDGSDELNCTSQITCDKEEFNCTSDSLCIPDIFRCDGSKDCFDGSDELDCPKVLCAQDEFNCTSDDICIPISFRCDSDHDCIDGSDELNCTLAECSGDEFQCMDKKKCIPETKLCDGFDDCNDRSDEAICSGHSTTRSPENAGYLIKANSCRMQQGKFPCQNDTTCLTSGQVCDGQEDCVDGSDEGPGCDKSCQLLMCSHGCFMTPKGHQCTCPLNFSLDHQNSICLGFSSGLLLVGLKHKLEAYSLDGSSSFTVYSSRMKDSGVIGVAYDPVEDMAYWSMKDKGGVYRKGLHIDRSPQFIIDTDEKVVEGLAIDWLGRNLYVADTGHQRILVCSLNGVVCSTLIPNITSSLRGIQLDLQNRKMFWTEWKTGIVESADMDGSRRSILVSDLGWPNALALDSSMHTLYWMDALTDTLEHIDYDGTNRTPLQDAKIDHPFAMDIFDDQLYWTDWRSDEIKSCSKKDCATKTVVNNLLNRPFGIKVIHPDLYSEIQNPCKHDKCSHLCLLSMSSPHGYTCTCPVNLFLKEDHHTCGSAPLE